MRLYLRTKDYSISQEDFELLWEEELDMLRTHPMPEILDTYYDSEDYISHTDANSSFTDKLYQWAKRRNLKRKIQTIDNQVNKRKKLMDFGAGTGDFVQFANQYGFEAFGVEPSGKARNLASAKGVMLFPNLEAAGNETFHVITLWHVLEHLPDLENQIERIISRLNPEGTLVVAVPNFKSFDAKYYKGYWAGYDVPRHLWHFSKTSIKELFKKQGFKITLVKPMWFDAFYVSMLSEKYKGNSLYLLNAFMIGLWSNLNAIFTKEYSSLIYVLKREKTV